MGSFDGTLRARDEEAARIAATKFPAWVQGVAFHGTSAPNLKQARETPYQQGSKFAKGPDLDKAFAQRMRNFKTRVSQIGGQGWHATAFENGKIGEGCPLTVKGSAHNSWNGTHLAIEMCLDGDGTDPATPQGQAVLDTAAWWVAQVLTACRLTVNEQTVRFHNDEPSAKRRGKTCPGRLVMEAWLVERVKHYMTQPVTPPVTPVVEQPMEVAYVATPGDTLNFRRAPAGEIKGRLPDRTKVQVVQYQGAWAEVISPAGYKGWVGSKYLKAELPVILPPLPPEVVLPPDPAGEVPKPDVIRMAQGAYKADAFCYEWARRFEAKMLKVYNDAGSLAALYGHNNGALRPPLWDHVGQTDYQGRKLDDAFAEEVLAADIKAQEGFLNKLVSVELTQGQVNALCLHLFQQGPTYFKNGKVRKLVNDGKHDEVALAIENWPTTNKGLIRRRGVEAAIYRGGKPTKW